MIEYYEYNKIIYKYYKDILIMYIMIFYFDLENENGFFCVYFFLLSSYISIRKNNLQLAIKDDKWKFLYKNGFDDYFIFNKYIIKYDDNIKDEKIRFTHMIEPNINHTLNEYKIFSKELYNINPDIIINYDNLLPKKYNSIFLRGGDKLLYEAKQHPISQYVNFLLNLNLETNNLFVHSDDNLLVEEIESYILQNSIKINIFKITDSKCNGGAVVMKRLKYGTCKNIKSIDEMNNNERKEHTVLLLNAIEIMRKSDNVILSFDSNFSRFMKINFDCNVYCINHSNKFNYDIPIKNPAYGF